MLLCATIFCHYPTPYRYYRRFPPRAHHYRDSCDHFIRSTPPYGPPPCDPLPISAVDEEGEEGAVHRISWKQ